MNTVASENHRRPGEYDPLASNPAAVDNIDVDLGDFPKPPGKMIHLFTPTALRNYVPPADQNLVGDYHLQKGAISVLAGPPGCGKSRGALYLGILGARGAGNWFGFEVHSRFRTVILQNENGLTRLHRDMLHVKEDSELDNWLRISAPPARGLAFNDERFRDELKTLMQEFAPQLLILDPWNACVRDSMERDFQDGLSHLRGVLAESPGNPACLILHHFRKPKSDDQYRGTKLANLLSGSYVLGSVARSVFAMQRASDDTEEARVVVTCSKNNDGAHGERSVWKRCDGALFEPVESFDWDGFDGKGATHAAKVTEEHLRTVFGQSGGGLAPNIAAKRLREVASVGRTAAYEALKTEGGRFSNLLLKDGNGVLRLKKCAPIDEDSQGNDEPALET